MDALPERTALVLVDMQVGMDDTSYFGERNNPGLEANLEALLWVWRRTHRPVFHVQHRSPNPRSPLHPGKPGYKLKPRFRPIRREPLLKKQVNSAFIGTDLKARLWNQHIDSVVIAGLTTNHCVSTTVRMAGNFGFDVYLPADGAAAFGRRGKDGRWFDAELVHQMSLANLHGEFATVTDVETLYARAMAQERRERASLIIVCDGKMLLIHRRHRGREFYTIPGGGLEVGESPEQAALREAKEETGLDVQIAKPLWTYAAKNHFFLVTDFCGDLCLGGPEAELAGPDNMYALEWVPVDRLTKLSLSPVPVGRRIVQMLRGAAFAGSWD